VWRPPSWVTSCFLPPSLPLGGGGPASTAGFPFSFPLYRHPNPPLPFWLLRAFLVVVRAFFFPAPPRFGFFLPKFSGGCTIRFFQYNPPQYPLPRAHLGFSDRDFRRWNFVTLLAIFFGFVSECSPMTPRRSSFFSSPFPSPGSPG